MIQLMRQKLPYLKQRKEVSCETLIQLQTLCRINSKTSNIKGVNKVQNYLTKKLEDLGFSTRLISNLKESSGELLVAEYQGQVRERIVFISHADTVIEKSKKHNFSYDKNSGKISCPGISDNKGGIVTALSGVEDFLKQNKNPYYTLTFVCSPNEETGSNGFHEIFKKLGSEAKFILGFEPALKNGSLISARNGNRWYKIQTTGIQSHAGRFGPEALNAAHEFSIKMSNLHKLNDYENKVKVNVGSITGGTGHYNIVCADINALIDVRFPCLNSRENLHQKIIKELSISHLKCVVSGKESKSMFKITDDCPPLPFFDHSIFYLNTYCKIVSNIEGRPIQHQHSGGAADINYFANKNAIMMDGLGPIGYGMHTNEEHIFESSLFYRIKALRKFLTFIQRTNGGDVC